METSNDTLTDFCAGKPAEPTPKNRHRVVTRSQIIDTALAEFADRGYEEATLAAISRKLGVTAPLLIYHFGSKERLWKEAMEVLFRRLERVVAAAVEDGEGLDGLRASETLLRRLVYFFAANRELHRVLALEGSTKNPRLDWIADRYVLPLFAEIESVFRRAVDEGAIKPVKFDYALFMILGAASHYLDSKGLVSALHGPQDLTLDRLNDYADQVLDFCFHGLASDTAWTPSARQLEAVAG